MNQPSWDNAAGGFIFDGSWRDIYVFDTDAKTWQQMLDGFRDTGYDLVFKRDGTPSDLPKSVKDIFANGAEAHPLLWVRFEGMIAACHFFTPEEIEFDIDPREVRGPKEFEALLDFMRLVSSLSGRDAVMTLENIKDVVIFRACFGNGKIEYTPRGDRR